MGDIKQTGQAAADLYYRDEYEAIDVYLLSLRVVYVVYKWRL